VKKQNLIYGCAGEADYSEGLAAKSTKGAKIGVGVFVMESTEFQTRVHGVINIK
jgi:hypothetical protein